MEKLSENMCGRMDWRRLVSAKRLGLEEYHDSRNHNRSDFQRDYDRMIFSSPFRRLQNKTQVFPLPGSIFVHNRLTHSLEVSCVGRSMGNLVADGLRRKYGTGDDYEWAFSNIGDIVATGCLCHDLGNPPFGHSGEKAISTFFSEGDGGEFKELLEESQWLDLINFEGNANSLRLLTHQFAGRRRGGFAMTYASLASIVKYPFTSRYAGEKGKFGFFSSEVETYRRVAAELGVGALDETGNRFMRYPLVYVVEAADDICYQIMDIEDAHKLKILSHEATIELLLAFFSEERRKSAVEVMSHLSDPNERVSYLRSGVIGVLTEGCAAAFLDHEDEIMEGRLQGSLIMNLAESRVREAYESCSRMAYAHIYNAPEVVDVELAGHKIITDLLRRLLKAVKCPHDYGSRLLLSKVPSQYEIASPDLFERVQAVLDHVSGMTDVYALDLYRKLNGQSLPAV